MESDIVERLRAVLHNDRSVELMNREAADEIERLRAERDEARRMLCEDWAKQDGLPLDWQGRRGAEGMAEFVKWDCFKENNNDRTNTSRQSRITNHPNHNHCCHRS